MCFCSQTACALSSNFPLLQLTKLSCDSRPYVKVGVVSPMRTPPQELMSSFENRMASTMTIDRLSSGGMNWNTKPKELVSNPIVTNFVDRSDLTLVLSEFLWPAPRETPLCQVDMKLINHMSFIKIVRTRVYSSSVTVSGSAFSFS